MGSSGLPADQHSLCEYTLLENGIHRMLTKQNSQAAANALIAYYERLYQDHMGDPFIRDLVSSEQGTLPMVYTVRRFNELAAKYPQRPMVLGAVLVESSFIPMLNSMVTLLRTPDKMHYFRPNQYDEAIVWLLSAEIAPPSPKI
jgi:hypothetical protein